MKKKEFFLLELLFEILVINTQQKIIDTHFFVFIKFVLPKIIRMQNCNLSQIQLFKSI